jgi:cyanate lyase
LDTQLVDAFARRGIIGTTRLAHKDPYRGGGSNLPSRLRGSGDSIGSVPRSIASAPTAGDGVEWRSATRKLERRLDTEKRELKIKFAALDQTLDRDFDYVENELTRIARDAAIALQEAREAKATLDHLNIEGSIQAHLTSMGARGSFPTGGRSVTPPPTFHWSNLSQAEQADLLAGIIAGLNEAGYAQAVGNTLGLRKITETVGEVEGRLMDVEREFNQDQGIVSRLQQSVAGIEARRNVSA